MMIRNLVVILLAFSIAGCMGDGGVRVEGRVLGPAGAPVAGALVYLDDPGRIRYPASFEETTDPDGSFRIATTVARGQYAIPLVVEAKGLKSARVDIQTLADNVVEARLVVTGSDSASTMQFK